MEDYVAEIKMADGDMIFIKLKGQKELKLFMFKAGPFVADLDEYKSVSHVAVKRVSDGKVIKELELRI